jgi:hypothetical protein
MSVVCLAAGTSALYAGKLVDRTIAVVNGEHIFLSEFEQIAEPMIEQYKKENPDWTKEKIREFEETILDELVNNKLIVQEANKRRIHVSKRQLDEQMGKVRDQFPSQKVFEEELEKQNLTEKKLKKRIEEQLMAEELTHIEVKSKVEKPTAEEIEELLLILKKKLNGETIKGLTEQEEQSIDSLVKLIDNYLSNLEAQEKYKKWIKNLRLNSKIKINSIE